MSETERRYAQIEKEALAITWAFEKFSAYVLGKSVTVETDHRPLVPLLGTKHLDSLPARILQFRLRLDRFHYTIQYVPGKHLYTTDTPSRAPLSEMEHLAELAATAAVTHLPASSERLEYYHCAQRDDPACSLLTKYSLSGWPEKNAVDPAVKPYRERRGELTICDNLLLCGNRIVVPEALREETLTKIHQGHQGIQRCRLRAHVSVWWPGISEAISKMVERCPECTRDSKPNREPLTPTQLPDHPWQKLGSDLFVLNGNTYILVVDYFS